jgi:hypothetical protein
MSPTYNYGWFSINLFVCYSRELPHVDCVPSSELNQTVELYKLLVKLLPNPKGCMEEHSMMSLSMVKILTGNLATFI